MYTYLGSKGLVGGMHSCTTCYSSMVCLAVSTWKISYSYAWQRAWMDQHDARAWISMDQHGSAVRLSHDAGTNCHHGIKLD